MKDFKINVTNLIIATLIVGLGGLSFFAYFKTRALIITNLEMYISALTLSSGSEVGLWLKTQKEEIEIMAHTPLIESGDKVAIISYLNLEIRHHKEYE